MGKKRRKGQAKAYSHADSDTKESLKYKGKEEYKVLARFKN